MHFQRILVSVLVLAAAASTPAWSTTVFYCSIPTTCPGNDQTAFNNATSSLYFQGVNITSGNLVSGGLVDSSTGVTIADINTYNSNLVVSGSSLTDNGHGFYAALPSSVYDFWFTLTGPSGATLYLTFDANGAYENGSFTLGSSPLFVGVTSAAPITNLQLDFTSSNTYTLTAFDINGASQAEAPEGATLLLIGSGLIAMRWLKKRDKQKAKRGETPAPARTPALVTPQIAVS